jgi:hypothetical protein
MEKSKISINITQEDIDNALLGIIDLNIKNRKDVAKLLSALIYDNTQCAEWFIKMSVGARYPTMPKVGDIGFIKLSEHVYGLSKDRQEEMAASPHNQHGYYPCSVARVGSIHQYCPLEINLPNPSGPGLWSISISVEKFYPGESIDIYEDLPI